MCTGNQDCGDCFDTSFIVLPTGETGLTGPSGANGTNGTNGINGTNGTDGDYFTVSSEVYDLEVSHIDGVGFEDFITINLPGLLNDGERYSMMFTFENINPPASNGTGLYFLLGGDSIHPVGIPPLWGNSVIRLPFNTSITIIEIEIIRNSLESFVIIKQVGGDLSGWVLGYIQTGSTSINSETALTFDIRGLFQPASSVKLLSGTIAKINN